MDAPATQHKQQLPIQMIHSVMYLDLMLKIFGFTYLLVKTKVPRGKGNCKSTFSYETKSIYLCLEMSQCIGYHQKCVSRVLQKFSSLKSCFLSEDWADEKTGSRDEKTGFKTVFENQPCYSNPVLFQYLQISISFCREMNHLIHLLKPAWE